MTTLITALGSCVSRMTMKVSKGLDFPAVALPGVGHLSAAGEDE